jgi:hypothetical protein
MRWVGHAECIVEMKNAYKILVGKPKGKRPVGRPRRTRLKGKRAGRKMNKFGTEMRPWRALVNSNETLHSRRGGGFLR